MTRKMHAPKNRSSLGTLLEPFAVGLQSWDNVIADINAPMDLRQGEKNEKIKVVLGTEELFPAIYWRCSPRFAWGGRPHRKFISVRQRG